MSKKRASQVKRLMQAREPVKDVHRVCLVLTDTDHTLLQQTAQLAASNHSAIMRAGLRMVAAYALTEVQVAAAGGAVPQFKKIRRHEG